MATGAGWYKAVVKAVPSGDSLVIMAIVKDGMPPEKTITLSSLIAPRLARRDTRDEPFAWESREFLRQKCIGKEVTFKVDYTVPNLNNREFASVFIGKTNIAVSVVTEGWARVRQAGQNVVEKSPYLEELLQLEEAAQQQGIGIWNKSPGASEASTRSIPPSAVGESNFDVDGLLNSSKGKQLPAVVEQVRDGSAIRVYLLPSFQYIQVYLAGIQAPSMGRRALPADAPVNTDAKSAENGTSSPLTTAQKVAASTAAAANSEVPPDPYAREAKHFTEVRVLNRDVRIRLEGADKFKNLIGIVSYVEGEQEDQALDLSMELVKQGLARVVEWSANMLDEDEKRRLKNAELQAKKEKLRIWTNYVPPPSNSTAIHNDVFTGKVIEVVSGDCIVVADDTTERRVNLSSVQAVRRERPDAPDREKTGAEKAAADKNAAQAYAAREYLRSMLIGQQVYVAMEYSRTVAPIEGGSRVMDFGSVFLLSPTKGEVVPTAPASGPPPGVNVAELAVANGYAQVVRHRDHEERSNYYDALMIAEKKAIAGKKGMHSSRSVPSLHINDLTVQVNPQRPQQANQKLVQATVQRAKQFLPFLQRVRRLPALVEYVFSGHRYKLSIPKETCAIAFSLSGVRCPGRGLPYSDEAMSFMRRLILQRDVEIEIETVDRNGTFLGSLWEGKTNVAIPLLEAGLAKMQTNFVERITEGHLLAQAEEKAKKLRLKVWEQENGAEATDKSTVDAKSKQEILQVELTEVLGGGKFYTQVVGDSRISAIQQQLESLKLKENQLPPINFEPKKGDLVIAHYSEDNSWYRGLIVKALGKGMFEVFYVDYGNQANVHVSKLRPVDPSVTAAAASSQGLAQLCSLAHVKVPDLEEDFGVEAAEFLFKTVSGKKMMAKIEEKDTSGGKTKSQGTGSRFIVTLIDESSLSVNAALVEAGLARVEKCKRWDSKEKQSAVEALLEYQEKARKGRLNIWQYGDIESDEEDQGPARRGGGA